MTLSSRYLISAGNATLQRISVILDATASRGQNPPIAISLTLARDVDIVGGRTIATSEEPWLKFRNVAMFKPGGFVEITYRASFFDDPVRPILRFRMEDGAEIDRFLPGPVAGAAMWTGRVPPGTTEVWISPTRHRGRFDFIVETVRRRNWLALWLKALWRSPRYALSAAFYGVPGFTAEFDMNLDWALGFTPLAEFDTWWKERARPIDLQTIDAPRADWTRASRVHVIVHGSNERDISLRSLAAQIYPNWRLQEAADWPVDAPGDDLAFALRSGDRLQPQAFACAVEHAARHPMQLMFYGDEIEHGEGGDLAPALKPDWSPLLQAARPYLGRAIFARIGFLRSCGIAASSDFARAIGAPGAFPSDAIGHLRRMLLTRGKGDAEALRADAEREEPVPPALSASIIIPTKDGGLLEKCVDSIFTNTSGLPYKIVIIDNGSVTPATRALLGRLAEDPHVTILSDPAPFNFAALCNAGAAAGSEPILVFLNDDTAVRSPGWLAELSLAASRPDVGAVGARLLYADGRLQHAGVALGIGETGGHFGAGADPADPGWVGQHHLAHETSAVTGACLAVERKKFEAVGGFDSEHLPIELNDLDLCLRLAERGWKSLCLSQISLFHEESASRGGAKFRLLKVHAEERKYFVGRWRRVVRDDPYFHPGFSLFRRQQALG